MATSVGLNIITGRTGEAHVASDDDAAIWRGLVGDENVVLFTDQKLALTNNGKQNDVGSLTIANGVFSIKGGHMGRVDNTATVTYALPNEGNFRRTLVIIRYAKVGTMESMRLMTLQNATVYDATSASAAAALSVSTVPSTDYVLYDFVCNSDGLINNTLQTKLTVIDTIPILRAALNAEASARQAADTVLGSRVSTLETFKSTEKAARESADTALGSRVSTLETWKNSRNGDKYKLIAVYAPSSTGYGGVDYVVCPTGQTTYKAMWRHNTAINEYNMYFYKVTLDQSGTSVSVNFYKLGASAHITGPTVDLASVSGGSATIIGNVTIRV